MTHRILSLFFFNDTATTEIYTLSLHDALPILAGREAARRQADPAGRREPRHQRGRAPRARGRAHHALRRRSEEHTSELQSRPHLVCRLLLEKKKKRRIARAYNISDTRCLVVAS